MPLKLLLKPHDRVIIDGAVVSNGGSATELIIENKVPILRQKYILSEKDANSPCRRIYFVVQLMYIDEKNLSLHHKTYWKLIQDFIQAVPSALPTVEQISNHILGGQYYQALKLARNLIDYEEEIITRVQEFA